MRILVQTIHHPPDVSPTGDQLAELAAGLAARGHDVEVVTSLPHNDGFRIAPAYRGKLVRTATERGVKVRRAWVYANGKKHRFLGRVLNYASYNVMAGISTVFSRKRDVIFAANASFLTGLTGAFSGLLRRTPFVLHVLDVYPDAMIRTGALRNRALIRLLKALEKAMYRRARHVTVLTPGFRENLLAKGVPPGKVSVVPIVVDTDRIRPFPKDNAFSRAHGLHDKFVVAYAGNLGLIYDLDSLLELAERVRKQEDIRILIVGNGVAKARLVEAVKARGLDNVVFVPFQPHEVVPLVRATADVHVNLYKRGMASNSIPSKVYEIFASARPLIVSAEETSDTAALIRQAQAGLCIAPEDPDALVEAVLRLHADPNAREAVAARGRAFVQEGHSKDVVVAKLEAVLARAARISS